MASKTKMIGTIGEQVLVTEFVKNNIPVLLPVGDNLPYDMIIEISGKFVKIQVKTTERIKDCKMIFSTNMSNPYKKSSRKYTEKEIDMFGLHCLENGYIGLLPFGDCTAKETVIRLESPKNNQMQNIKMADDYAFCKMVKELLIKIDKL